MFATNETHDFSLASWVESANDPATDFPIQNLPLGVFSPHGGEPRPGCAIGDRIVDLRATADLGLLPAACAAALRHPDLNAFMALPRAEWSALRLALSRLLRAGAPGRRVPHYAAADCELLLPASIGDYTDFYASVFHATNIGGMFRPDNPLLPNYKYVPIGYHGRASSVVPSGTAVRRPHGQIQNGNDLPPVFRASRQLDYECEAGAFLGGPENPLGEPVPMRAAADRLFGLCLLNDWSARDIQRWEYQPLGPFLAKSFATTISPWIVTTEALAPFRAPRFARPAGDPQPLDYLEAPEDRESGAFDIEISVWIATARMRESGLAPFRLSAARFADMYWTFAQMVAHHASNGCNLRPGDLLGSGTVSGPEPGSRGSLLELSWRGTQPVELPGGEKRSFLEDGDEVILRAECRREGFRRIGFGECRGILAG